MKKKITYVISNIDRALSFEWTVKYLRETFQLSFILLNPGPSALETFLIKKRIPVYTVRYRGKKDWLSAFFKVLKIIKKINPDVVHTHFFEANNIGLLAARLASVRKRVYTRHHSSLHHVSFKKGVWWDRLANKLATQIISISDVVTDILISWEKVPKEKIVYIPHGIHVEDFRTVDAERINQFKTKHGIPEDLFVVGVISRLTEWKGVQYCIEAFKQFLIEDPLALLLVLNATGDYYDEIRKLLTGIPEANYRLIPFEWDVPAAYKTFDVFVHVPTTEHSEAFGLVYLEALASGVPSIFTLSGIAHSFIEDGKNALVVPFRNSAAIHEALHKLCNDYSLREQLAKNGLLSVEENFPFENTLQGLEKLYDQ